MYIYLFICAYIYLYNNHFERSTVSSPVIDWVLSQLLLLMTSKQSHMYCVIILKYSDGIDRKKVIQRNYV